MVKWELTIIFSLLCRLKVGGLLILGSIDDTREGQMTEIPERHSLAVLKMQFKRIPVPRDEFPHIYRETLNKHQYAISYLSAWTKLDETAKDVTDFSVIPSSNDVANTTDYYENDNILKSYDAFHFGSGLLSVKNFPLHMAEVIIEMCEKYGCRFKSALDAGCGPGRTAMELCTKFEQVVLHF